MFQSLVGKLETQIGLRDRGVKQGFQSLVGKLETHIRLAAESFVHCFNPL